MSEIETLARKLYCAQENISYDENKDHVEYWFSDHATAKGDVCVREEYERMARVALAHISDEMQRAMIKAAISNISPENREDRTEGTMFRAEYGDERD